MLMSRSLKITAVLTVREDIRSNRIDCGVEVGAHVDLVGQIFSYVLPALPRSLTRLRVVDVGKGVVKVIERSKKKRMALINFFPSN